MTQWYKDAGLNITVSLCVFFSLLYAISPPVSLASGRGGNRGALYLLFRHGARPEAMGGAFGAVGSDGNSIDYNPAGLGFVRRQEITATHIESMESQRIEYLRWVQKYSNPWTSALALDFSGVQDVERDIYAQEHSDFYNYSIVGTLGLAYQVLDNLSLGLNTKIYGEKLYNESDINYAFDMGVMWQAPFSLPFGRNSRLRFGVSALNIGPKIELGGVKSQVPETVKLSTSLYFYELYIPFIKNITLTSDVDMQSGGNPIISTGLELQPFTFLSFRTGYKFSGDINDEGAFRLGFGVEQAYGVLDYAYIKYNTIDSMHIVTYTIPFGEKSVRKK